MSLEFKSSGRAEGIDSYSEYRKQELDEQLYESDRKKRFVEAWNREWKKLLSEYETAYLANDIEKKLEIIHELYQFNEAMKAFNSGKGVDESVAIGNSLEFNRELFEEQMIAEDRAVEQILADRERKREEESKKYTSRVLKSLEGIEELIPLSNEEEQKVEDRERKRKEESEKFRSRVLKSLEGDEEFTPLVNEEEQNKENIKDNVSTPSKAQIETEQSLKDRIITELQQLSNGEISPNQELLIDSLSFRDIMKIAPALTDELIQISRYESGAERFPRRLREKVGQKERQIKLTAIELDAKGHEGYNQRYLLENQFRSFQKYIDKCYGIRRQLQQLEQREKPSKIKGGAGLDFRYISEKQNELLAKVWQINGLSPEDKKVAIKNFVSSGDIQTKNEGNSNIFCHLAVAGSYKTDMYRNGFADLLNNFDFNQCVVSSQKTETINGQMVSNAYADSSNTLSSVKNRPISRTSTTVNFNFDPNVLFEKNNQGLNAVDYLIQTGNVEALESIQTFSEKLAHNSFSDSMGNTANTSNLGYQVAKKLHSQVFDSLSLLSEDDFDKVMDFIESNPQISNIPLIQIADVVSNQTDNGKKQRLEALLQTKIEKQIQHYESGNKYGEEEFEAEIDCIKLYYPNLNIPSLQDQKIEEDIINVYEEQPILPTKENEFVETEQFQPQIQQIGLEQLSDEELMMQQALLQQELEKRTANIEMQQSINGMKY